MAETGNRCWSRGQQDASDSEADGNENVGWEMSNTWDLGFDIGLFNNRISAVVDLYQTKTTDILSPYFAYFYGW